MTLDWTLPFVIWKDFVRYVSLDGQQTYQGFNYSMQQALNKMAMVKCCDVRVNLTGLLTNRSSGFNKKAVPDPINESVTKSAACNSEEMKTRLRLLILADSLSPCAQTP